MSALDARLERLCRRFDAMPLWRAILALAATALAASFVLAVTLAWPVHLSGLDPRLPVPPQKLLARGVAWAVLYAVLFMPLLETLLLQAFPHLVARRFTRRPAAVVATMTAAFAAAHAVFSSLAHGVAMLGAGSVLGFAFYWAARRPPPLRPVMVTYAIHALNNFFVLGTVFAVLALLD